MMRTLGREIISTRQEKLAKLAQIEPKRIHFRSFLDQRVRDGVFTDA